MTTRMRHPALPPGQHIDVPDSAVPHHRAAGWQVFEPAAPGPTIPPETDGGPTPKPARPRGPSPAKE